MNMTPYQILMLIVTVAMLVVACMTLKATQSQNAPDYTPRAPIMIVDGEDNDTTGDISI